MNDFYNVVRDALSSGEVDKLSPQYCSDPNIVLSTSIKSVTILPEAFYKSISGNNSFEHIYERAKTLGIEIPFAGIIDEDKMEIIKFFKGVNGSRHMCYWTKGNLLEKSIEYAKKNSVKVSLGHTHPVFKKTNGEIDRAYGAICSWVYYQKSDLESFDDKTSKKILDSGLYENFGGDYLEMYMRSKEEHFSDYFWILSPRLDQVGFFKIKEKGKVEYHPVELKK